MLPMPYMIDALDEIKEERKVLIPPFVMGLGIDRIVAAAAEETDAYPFLFVCGNAVLWSRMDIVSQVLPHRNVLDISELEPSPVHLDADVLMLRHTLLPKWVDSGVLDEIKGLCIYEGMTQSKSKRSVAARKLIDSLDDDTPVIVRGHQHDDHLIQAPWLQSVLNVR